MTDEELQDLMKSAMRHAGVNDVMKLYQDQAKRANRSASALHTQYRRGTLVSANSTD